MDLVDDAVEAAVDKAIPSRTSGQKVGTWRHIRHSASCVTLGYFLASAAQFSLPSMTVHLMDEGFEEVHLATLHLVATLPLTFKACYAPIFDWAPPPWTGRRFLPKGRRRPFIAVEADAPTIAGTTVIGFLMVSGSSVGMTALDSLVSEMLARQPPEYLPARVTHLSPTMASLRGGAVLAGLIFDAIFLNVLGAGWSWRGAVLLASCLVLAGPPTLLGLSDVVHKAPRHSEPLSTAILCDFAWCRGAQKDLLVFHRKLDLVIALLSFSTIGIMNLSVPYLKRTFDITAEEQASLMVVTLLASMAAYILTPFLTKWVNARNLLQFSFLVTWIIPLFIVAIVEGGHKALCYPINAFCYMLLSMSFILLSSTLFANMVPSAPAVSFALAMTAWNLGADLSLTLLIVAQYGSYFIAYCITSGVLMLNAVLIWKFFTNEERFTYTSKAHREEQQAKLDAAAASVVQAVAGKQLTAEQTADVAYAAVRAAADPGFDTPRALQAAAAAAEKAIAALQVAEAAVQASCIGPAANGAEPGLYVGV
eukprot:NODE_3862_length_1971_cov_17.268980.p1 GENE.NODE_3862_length_1971_cov_17.268980~~NODE_3862_length_1971_cov_17.268980.p1  ORF type:complete len:536 (-),score=114.86 NODE_3862_length_1971_cov_17.268980:268-1875(-)